MSEVSGEPEVEVEVPPPVTEDSDTVDYLKDGKTRFTFDGKTYTLRRPRLGEFRHLRQMMIDGANVPPADQLDVMVKWVQEVFAALSDRPLPTDVDEWPTWLGTGGFQSPLVMHWRDVPLGLGGTATG